MDFAKLEGFLKSCGKVVMMRVKFFVILNVLFLDSIFVGVILGQFFSAPSFYIGEPLGILVWLRGLDWFWMILAIFLFNLVLSGFVVLALPGLVFFPLSAVVLAMRGILWGIMLNQPSIVPFFALLPTFIFEGEGYVLISMVGTILGLSWLEPDWMYKGEYLSRLDALKTALREALLLLFLGAVMLSLAAIVETLTIKGA